MLTTENSRGEAVEEEDRDKAEEQTEMLYDYKTQPRWYHCLVMGLQHFLTMCLPNALSTIIIMRLMCLRSDDPIKSELISASFFSMGLTTLMQTVIGTRLPIIQGATYSLLVPTMSLLSMSEMANCNVSSNIFVQRYTTNSSRPQSVAMLQIRMITGAMMTASMVEVILSVSGLLNLLVRLITPLSLSTIFVSLALSIVTSIMNMMGQNWSISLLATTTMLLFILVVNNVEVPCCWWRRTIGCFKTPIRIFQSSPIILSIAVIWILSAVLTFSGAFSKDENHWTYSSRVDSKVRSILISRWFKWPLPFQWGTPVMMPGIVISMLAGVLVSTIESVGDYMVTAKICQAPPPPKYAINRGIFVEGIGVFLSGLIGSVVGPTSYSDNIGLLKITKIGNRLVAQVAAVLMLLCGVFPIFGAVFVSIPDPIVGGVVIVVTFTILGVGIGYLQYVNINSTRNALVFSFSVGFSTYLPIWAKKNKQSLITGNQTADDIIETFLSINMIIAAVISIVMDNILPGKSSFMNKKDSKIDSVETESRQFDQMEIYEAYDIAPLKWIALRFSWLQYLPLFPNYKNIIVIPANDNLYINSNDEPTDIVVSNL